MRLRGSAGCGSGPAPSAWSLEAAAAARDLRGGVETRKVTAREEADGYDDAMLGGGGGIRSAKTPALRMHAGTRTEAHVDRRAAALA